ncbi:MAG: hypothetical protein WC943_10055 [Elusimicrobiota bacterium]|jgi:hypothetical protein
MNRDIHVRLSRGRVIGGIVAGLCVFLAYGAIAETLTVTSYYPSPAGVYQRLRTLGDAFFAVGGGRVGVGTCFTHNSAWSSVTYNSTANYLIVCRR